MHSLAVRFHADIRNEAI